jgi:hypothetical protein
VSDNDDDDDDREDDDIVRRLPRNTSPSIILLAERQHRLNKRVAELEKKQVEVTTMLNKGLGAAALLMGLGAGIGWLVSIGGSVMRWFKP